MLRTDSWQAFWHVFWLVTLFALWILVSVFIVLDFLNARKLLNSLSARVAFWVISPPIFATSYGLFVHQLFDGLASENQPWFVLSSALVAFSAGLVAAVAEAYFDRWRRQIKANSEVRLEALQARTRPHFVFNSLNTIAALIPEQPAKAEEATLDLSDLLRSSLANGAAHPLVTEFELIDRYLRLESLRLGSRLRTERLYSEDFPLDQPIPPLLLQPLVENAIIHGISRRAKGGTVRIEGKRIRFGRIRVTVTNPLGDSDSRPADGNRSALENIRQRLALAYEERYGLKTRIEDGHFIAELTIPIES